MKRLVVAIDCDDVLIHATEHIVTTYNKLYGTKVLLEHAHISGNEERQADRQEVFQRLNDIQRTSEYAAIVPPPETVQVIARLAKIHELHMITARPPEVLEVTQRMVEQHFPDCFISIDHLGPDESKGKACAKLHADMLIDDNIRHLLAAREYGVEWRIWFGKYAWQDEADSAIYTNRVSDWSELEAEIARIAG